MKSEPPFSKLPALSELLRHPTVQGIVERVNQTTIAQRATGFWEDLQTNWQEQGGMPSVGELAERLAQRLLGKSRQSSPIVNATGILCSQRWQAPLADSAVHEVLRFASDYQQPSAAMLDQVASSLVKLTGAEAAWVASSFEAAVSMAKQCEEGTIVSSPVIGLFDSAEFSLESFGTLESRLNGADLVVIDGAGLLGGPRCGIIVGAGRFLQKIQQSELATALVADSMVLVALEATLEIYRSPETAIHQIPVLQLMSTSQENLRQRCERIAPLLAESELVASAEVSECMSVWLDAGNAQLSAASWAIALCPADGSVDRLVEQYRQATPQVVGRVEEGTLWLDFRAIFPRWDQQLITALE